MSLQAAAYVRMINIQAWQAEQEVSMSGGYIYVTCDTVSLHHKSQPLIKVSN